MDWVLFQSFGNNNRPASLGLAGALVGNENQRKKWDQFVKQLGSLRPRWRNSRHVTFQMFSGPPGPVLCSVHVPWHLTEHARFSPPSCFLHPSALSTCSGARSATGWSRCWTPRCCRRPCLWSKSWREKPECQQTSQKWINRPQTMNGFVCLSVKQRACTFAGAWKKPPCALVKGHFYRSERFVKHVHSCERRRKQVIRGVTVNYQVPTKTEVDHWVPPAPPTPRLLWAFQRLCARLAGMYGKQLISQDHLVLFAPTPTPAGVKCERTMNRVGAECLSVNGGAGGWAGFTRCYLMSASLQ